VAGTDSLQNPVYCLLQIWDDVRHNIVEINRTLSSASEGRKTRGSTKNKDRPRMHVV